MEECLVFGLCPARDEAQRPQVQFTGNNYLGVSMKNYIAPIGLPKWPIVIHVPERYSFQKARITPCGDIASREISVAELSIGAREYIGRLEEHHHGHGAVGT